MDRERWPRPDTVIFVGHARLPQALGNRGESAVVSVEAEVDLATREIVDVACFPAPRLAERLVRGELIGRNIEDGLDSVVIQLQHRYICPSQRALSTAIANVYEAYTRWLASSGAPSARATDPRRRTSRTD